MRPTLSALLACALSAGGWGALRAEEALPPPPTAHFNDYARLLSAADAQRLEAKLADFEKQTSTQIVVAVVAGIAAVGSELARHFPRSEGDGDRNELPDTVSRDE